MRSSIDGGWGSTKIYSTHKYRVNSTSNAPQSVATNTIWMGSNWLPSIPAVVDNLGSYYLTLIVPPETPSFLQVEISGWMSSVSNGNSLMTVTRAGVKVYSRRRGAPYVANSTYIVRHLWNDFQAGDILTFMGYESSGLDSDTAPPIVDDFALTSFFAYSVSSGLQITALS